MQTTETRTREFSTHHVLALTYVGLLMTHLVQRVSEDNEWVWWAWAVALTLQMLFAVVQTIRHRV